MISSIANFSGLQKMSLYKTADEPFLISYVKKVAEEYPTYRIELLIRIAEQIDPEKRAFIYNYEPAIQVLQKYGAEIPEDFTTSDYIYAQAPPSLQLITELSNLPDVQSIEPNCVFEGWINP
jgi:hypothetical protein